MDDLCEKTFWVIGLGLLSDASAIRHMVQLMLLDRRGVSLPLRTALDHLYRTNQGELEYNSQSSFIASPYSTALQGT